MLAKTLQDRDGHVDGRVAVRAGAQLASAEKNMERVIFGSGDLEGTNLSVFGHLPLPRPVTQVLRSQNSLRFVGSTGFLGLLECRVVRFSVVRVSELRLFEVSSLRI